MKRRLAIIYCLALPLSAGAEDCRSLDVVEWILGDWSTSPNRVVIRETWHRASDTTFEGESTTRSVSDDELVNYETLRLVAMSNGIFYIAKVTHIDLPVPFRLTSCSESTFVFENPSHDAPRRLIYRLLDASSSGAPELEVRLEGDEMNDFSLFFHRK